MKKVIWGILFSALAISCLNEPDCFNVNNNYFGVSFRNDSTFTVRSMKIVSVTSDSTNFPLIAEVQANRVLLPINYLADTTNYYFTFDPEGERKLTIAYRSRAQFLSEACGERFQLDNLSVVEADFDSVRLVNATPTINTATPPSHVELYLKP